MDVSETSCEEETWIYLIYVITYDWILCSVVDEPWGFIAASFYIKLDGCCPRKTYIVALINHVIARQK